jgi:hypothetical protein
MQKGRYIIQLIPSEHCDKVDQGSKALEQIATLNVDVKKGSRNYLIFLLKTPVQERTGLLSS